jgi:hypothetical protein
MVLAHHEQPPDDQDGIYAASAPGGFMTAP